MIKVLKKASYFILIAAMLFGISAAALPAGIYTVSFVSEGGGLVSVEKPFYAAGEEVEITAVPHDGFAFFGWVTNDAVIERTSELSAKFIMPANNVKIRVVFAVKQADTKEQISVTFNTNGGTSFDSVYVDLGSPVQEPSTIPAKTGYQFAGWYADSVCTIPFDFSAPLYTGTIIYANWAVDNTTPAQTFRDVSEKDWFYKPVMALYEQKIINGMSANTFSPSSPVTRAQFATILANMSGAQLNNVETPFSDVIEGAWYAPAVSWAYSNGIVTGVSPTSFAPEARISRQDMAVMIMRYADKISNITLPDIVTPVTFADSSTIADYAADAVSAMQRAGIISGKPGNVFEPRVNALRSEACAMIYSLLDIIK